VLVDKSVVDSVDGDVQWRFFINASEQTSLAFQRDEPDLYEPQEEVPSRN
jgi:hypothetical protein